MTDIEPELEQDPLAVEQDLPTAPMTIRMIPTVEMSRPEMSALTAKYRIAPTAIRKSEVPIPTP